MSFPVREALRRRAQGVLLTLSLLVSVSSCQRRDPWSAELVAPFNERTKIGEVRVRWKETGAEREGKVEMVYSMLARNSLSGDLYVRLSNPVFLDLDGYQVAEVRSSHACKLGPKSTSAVLEGAVRLEPRDARRIATFRVERLAVPLSERGRALYREWQIQSRRATPAEIDAEIASFLATPYCQAGAEAAGRAASRTFRAPEAER